MRRASRRSAGRSPASRPRPTPASRLLGYLVTMFNKALSVHVTYDGYLRELYGDDVFAAVVPLAKDFKEAVTFRKPIVEYKPPLGRGQGDRPPWPTSSWPGSTPAIARATTPGGSPDGQLQGRTCAPASPAR